MRAFIDTSSLFKKYVNEQGADTFDTLLQSVSEIIIAPITLLEINSIIERRLREKNLSTSDADWIEKEFMLDLNFYGVVEFNEALNSECIRVIRKYQMKVLDGIQLSSAIVAKPDVFIVSNKQLYKSATQELKQVEFVG
ncbi:MAG TPA: type II toxin-antitoxin system VapC family toxin [Chitinispirillaceae bacterium]|nr:type II toxin-antitoxin system VapC family toxin [Chitinispirillaceae bacterium]